MMLMELRLLATVQSQDADAQTVLRPLCVSHSENLNSAEQHGLRGAGRQSERVPREIVALKSHDCRDSKKLPEMVSIIAFQEGRCCGTEEQKQAAAGLATCK